MRATAEKNEEFRELLEKSEGGGKMAKDVVCGMDVDISASAVLRAEHQGKTYYFCTPSCRESFLKNPSKYLVKDPKFQIPSSIFLKRPQSPRLPE